MWYEVLPSFAIIIAATTATGVGMQFVQKAFNGGKVTLLAECGNEVLLWLLFHSSTRDDGLEPKRLG